MRIAIAFDAYRTLFDVFAVTALGEELFPGKGDALVSCGGSSSCSTACYEA